MKITIEGHKFDYPYIFVNGVQMPATFIARPANPRVDMGRRIIIEPALPEGGNVLLTADYLDFEINETVISDNPSAYTPADVLKLLNEGYESPTDDDFPGIGSGLYSGEIPDGSITTAKLADKAVTRKKLDDAAVGPEALGNASVTSVKILDGAVTSSKLAPGLDVSGLFFTLPKGTTFPYTLTEGDKAKLSAATILILPTARGLIPFQRSSNEEMWCSLRYTDTIWATTVSESSILTPVVYSIYDSTSVKFNVAQSLTAAQKLQARTNIGAAEVGTAALAPGAVTTDKIADGAVTTDKLATSSVATEKLQDLCVTTPKIADQAVDTTKLNTGGDPGGSVE